MLLQNTADPDPAAIMSRFAEAAQRSLADDFAALGPQDPADVAIMLWGIVNTMLSGAILHDLLTANVYRVADDAFIDLVAPRLPPDQRG